MKKMKKIMALIIAMVMVVATMNIVGATSATEDTSIKITGLDQGDEVNLYQVFKWDDGWKLTTDFAGMTPTANMQRIISNDTAQPQPIVFDKIDLDAIGKYVKDNNISPSSTYSGTVPASGEYEKDVDLGLYLALIKPSKAGTVYNPIVVSADFTAGGTNVIDSSEMMGTSSVAKKKTVTVDKTEPKITNDIGDTYTFTVETTIPVYSATFLNTYFTVSDEMTQYLDFDLSSFKVEDTSGTAITNYTSVSMVDKAHGWEIRFEDAYIKALTAPQDIIITYDAKLNIPKSVAATLPNAHVEENKVTIEFPNNPNNDTDKTVEKDETREYTFTIDGKLLGNSDWQNSELVKVAKDSQGNDILSEVKHSSGQGHSALDGATYGLYTTKADADAATAANPGNVYKNDVFDGIITTEKGGLLYVPGLDADRTNGTTYYLKELTAPAGYIKDSATHSFKIVPNIVDTPVTEYYTIDNSGNVTWSSTQTTGSTAFTYDIPMLVSYEVYVDDNPDPTYKYNMTIQGPSTSTSTIIKNSDSELINTKGVELPSTGGMGTTLFYVIGAILVLGAGILLVTRRRMVAR
jgi:fimbrial isopeptide formation D2 family protein/LPXTG-motif cell wall-anchored protein